MGIKSDFSNSFYSKFIILEYYLFISYRGIIINTCHMTRINRMQILLQIPSYAHIDYALVGNNSSVYISEFSDYGSLIGVCNKVKSVTNRNMDEYVVMHLSCQMLDIVDHLHAMGIIHADIKPDNFLLMKP